MRTLRTVGELRAALEPARGAGRTIGLVPTMGALHEGHLSLIRRAREECDVVVVSLFVNPIQFNEASDLERYPRDEQRDRALAQMAGGDLLFAPPAEEVYPKGFSTSVEVLGLTDRLEGAVRGSAHFKGVTTVVTKLLNMVCPNVAYFGQKDAQQVVVIKRLVQDLDMGVRIEACPTVREPDGLAMSSRNAHLSAAGRAQALALSKALTAAGTAASDGEHSAAALTETVRTSMSELEVEPEYVALVSPDTLEPISELDKPALLAIAARVDSTRLIDNVTLYPAAQVDRSPADLNCAVDPDHSVAHPNPATPRETQAICSV
ncbi:MAG: pantoate--beta-alanine ligase [Solirubrobacteraceae bacterium]